MKWKLQRDKYDHCQVLLYLLFIIIAIMLRILFAIISNKSNWINIHGQLTVTHIDKDMFGIKIINFRIHVYTYFNTY